MKKQFAIATVFVLGVLAATAHIAASKDSEERIEVESIEQTANELMKFLEINDLDGMFASLRKAFAMQDSELSPLHEVLKQQRVFISPKFGKPLGQVELVQKDEVGKSFIRLTYVEKWETSALVWKLTFYRPRNEWRLSEISWDDKPGTLFP